MLRFLNNLILRGTYARRRCALRSQAFKLVRFDRMHAPEAEFNARLDRDTRRLAATYRDEYIAGLFHDIERVRAV